MPWPSSKFRTPGVSCGVSNCANALGPLMASRSHPTAALKAVMAFDRVRVMVTPGSFLGYGQICTAYGDASLGACTESPGPHCAARSAQLAWIMPSACLERSDPIPPNPGTPDQPGKMEPEPHWITPQLRLGRQYGTSVSPAEISTDETTAPHRAGMDKLRTDLLTAAHSLLRLIIRIDARLAGAGLLHAHLVRIRHLDPSSPWLDACAPDNALSGARARALEVAERLLALVRSEAPVDPSHAALLMQRVAGDALCFSTRVQRFAERHAVILPESVRQDPRMHQVEHEIMRAVHQITGR